MGRDRFEAVGLLFLRVLQRDSTEAPKVMVAAAKGALWVAAVYIGEPPRELLAHYQRGTSDGQAMTRGAPTLSEAHRVATGSSGEEAFQRLHDGLVETLRARLEADLAAWERAMGAPFVIPRASTMVAPMPEVELQDGAGVLARRRS